ncbi:hypothetical protein GOB57_09135 [Sinorhizobium meliloti]|nr:hypothetical protein [Sinorhizobium meliloti]
MTSYREPLDFTARRLLEAENLLASWPLVEETDAAPDAEVMACLSDDLDTVGAVKALHGLAQKSLKSDDALEAFSASASLVGLGTSAPRLSPELTAGIEYLVEQRVGFVRAADWSSADGVRGRLAGLGISVIDYKDSETGERRSKWKFEAPALLPLDIPVRTTAMTL